MKIWHLAFGVYWLPPAVIQCPWGLSRTLVLEGCLWQRKGKIGAAQIFSDQRMLSELALKGSWERQYSRLRDMLSSEMFCRERKWKHQAPVRGEQHTAEQIQAELISSHFREAIGLILWPNGGELLYIRVPEVPRQCFSCTYFQVWFFCVDSKTVLCGVMARLL